MPPPSDKGFNPDRPTANKVFTNREHPIKVFKEAVQALTPDASKILVFHGIGGQGKSELCKEFQKRMTQKDKREDKELSKAIFGHIDLRKGELQQEGGVLFRLRNSFANNSGIPFPTFDIAFAAFWEKEFQELPPPKVARKLFARNEDIFTDIGAGGAEVGTHLLEGLPVGTILVKGGRWALKKIKPVVIKKIKKELGRLMRDGQIIPGHEIQDLLPYFLATDLKSYIQKKPETKLVCFFDDYESIWKARPTNPRLLRNPLEMALQELVKHCRGILFVFFSREKLNWEEKDPEWKNDFEGAQYSLRGLSEKDADAFLCKIPVLEPELRIAMIDGAKFQESSDMSLYAHPFLLDQQVNHYMTLKYNRSQSPKPEDFILKGNNLDKRVAEVVMRLLRDYPPELEWLLKRLSPTRWFNRKVVRALIDRFGIAFPMDEFEGVLKLSIISPIEGSEGDFAFQGLFKDLLYKELTFEMRNETLKFYCDYYLEHSKFDKPKDANSENLTALSEYVFHAIEKGDQIALQVAVEEVSNHQSCSYLNGLLHLANLLCNKASQLENKNINPTSKFFLNALLLKAQVLYKKGRYSEADPIFQKVLKFSEKTNNFDPRERFHLINCLGNNFTHINKYEDAELLYQRALKFVEEELESDQLLLSVSFNNLAFILDKQNKDEQSESLNRQSLKIREDLLEPNDPDLAITLNNLANTLSKQGKLEESEVMHRRALKIRKEVYGYNHTETLASLYNLAATLDKLKQSKDAETLYLQAVKSFEESVEEKHPNYFILLNNLAENYNSQGKYPDAELLFCRAVESSKLNLGEDHPHSLLLLKNLAHTYRHQKKYSEAELLYRRILKTQKVTLGYDHPDTINFTLKIARNLEHQEKYSEAEPFYKEIFEIQKTKLGLDHSFTLNTLNNLAVNLDNQQKYIEAEKLKRQAIKVLEKKLGCDHLDSVIYLQNLAYNLGLQNKIDEAETLYRRSLKITEDNLDDHHTEAIISLKELSICLYKQKKFLEVEELLHRSIKIHQEKLGEAHIKTIHSITDLIHFFEDQKSWDQAETLHWRALKICEAKFGHDHINIRIFLKNLAGNLDIQGRLNEAELLYRRWLNISETSLGKDHSETATPLNRLALNLMNQGQLKETEDLIRRALIVDMKEFGPNHLSTRKCFNNLAKLLDKLGLHDQATEFHKQSCLKLSDNKKFDPILLQSFKTNSLMNLVFKGKLEGVSKIDQLIDAGKEIFTTKNKLWSRIRSDLGVAFFLSGATEKAINIWHDVKRDLESNKSYKHSLYATVLYNLGEALAQKGEVDESKKILDEASSLDAECHGPGLAWRLKNLPS